MDAIAALKDGLEFAGSIKGLVIGGIALTFYDYILMFDDEIQYVWKGRKTFVFYLYLLNRFVLTGARIRDIYNMIRPRPSPSGCITESTVSVVLILFMWFSSDIFITLRVYAISLGNRFIAMYLGSLALLRFILLFASAFLRPFTFPNNIPILPVDTSNFCPTQIHLQFKVVPYALATTFDLSAFLIIAWCAYRIANSLQITVLIRTIVAEATIYLLAMVALQVYIQLSFALTNKTHEFSLAMYGFVNPILTMRFALSLKRPADSVGTRSGKSVQIPSIKFNSDSSSAGQSSAACETVEMDPVSARNQVQSP